MHGPGMARIGGRFMVWFLLHVRPMPRGLGIRKWVGCIRWERK